MVYFYVGDDTDVPIYKETERHIKMNDLKAEVGKILIANYDFQMDDAEETVNSSFETSPEMWNENAVAEDLAKFLASDENDE